MHTDARVTLYGGAMIAAGLFAFGFVAGPLLSITAVGIAGATLAVAALFDRVLPA